MLLELFGERRKKGKACSLLLPMWNLKLAGIDLSLAWVSRGVYIGLPPGGTMVIRLDMGPSRLCLHSPASAPAAGARRLPASWSTGRPHCPGLVGGWLLLLNLGGEGFTEVGVAIVPPPGRRSL